MFPVQDRRYKQFFEVDRYFNRLVREYSNPQEINVQYRSVTNEKERGVGMNQRKDLGKMAPPAYNSVNERRRGPNSREKPGTFSIRTQGRSGTNKRVYM